MQDELAAHVDWLRGLARALVGDAAADDVVQDTVEIALTHPPARPGPLRPWLAGVARNLARMGRRAAGRRERRELAAGLDGGDAEAPSPAELVERAQTQQLIARLVVELDEPFRATVLLRYQEGLSAAEIARAQGIPAGTVRWRLKHGLDQVRAQLDALHGGDRRRWAVLLAPLAAAPAAAGGTSLLLGGLLVKTGTKLAAIVAVLALAVAGARWLGWWGGGAAGPAGAPAAAPPPAPGPAPVAPAPRGDAPRVAAEAATIRDDDPRGPLRLEGQVIDEHDRPVGGAEVAVDSHPPRIAVTEGDGSFAFDGLLARDYRLEATAGDRYAGPARLRLRPDAEPVTLRMRPGAALAVTVRATDGAAIAGAEVELRGVLTWRATSGADGVATLRGIGPTWAPLHARAAGFAPAAAMVGTRGAPGEIETWTLTLARGAPVAGRVVDAAGKPVVGARVVALPAGEPFPVVDPRRDGVVTGPGGAFRIPAIPAGTFRLTAVDGAHAPATSAPITFDGETARDGIELRLAPGATVSGRVIDGAGRPVAAADVRVLGRGWVEWRMRRVAFTGDDGRFAIAGLPARAVEVVAWHPSGASAIVPLDLEATPAAELELVLDVTGAIAGIVVDPAGEPIGDAQVLAEPVATGDPRAHAVWQTRGLQEAVTDAGGAFVFAGLPDGAYTLRAARPGASDAALWLGRGTPARTGDAGVRVVLPGEGRIVGRVARPDGQPVGTFTISLGGAAPVPFGATRDDGRFELAAPAGTHALVVAGAAFAPVRRAGVEVAPGEAADVGTITVEPGRAVSGRVLDATGAPVAGAQVAAGRLLSGDGRALYLADESIGAKDATTDDDGRFVLAGFGAHPITVVAGRDGVGRSASVEIPRGESSVALDLVLDPVGGLDGTITRGGGPLADTVVLALPVGATRSMFFTVTGPDGTFALDALAPGTYVAHPMIGGGGSRPKDLYVRLVEVRAGARARVEIDASPGPVTLTVSARTDEGKPVLAGQLTVVHAAVDAPTVEALRTERWARVIASTTGAMHMRPVMGGPVEVAGVHAGRNTACVVPLPVGDDPSRARELAEDAERLPMKCVAVDVKAAPAAQRVEVVVPAAWTRPPP